MIYKGQGLRVSLLWAASDRAGNYTLVEGKIGMQGTFRDKIPFRKKGFEKLEKVKIQNMKDTTYILSRTLVTTHYSITD